MQIPTTRIVIFAKAPIAGFAKTRLIPALGEAGSARLAHKLLCHVVQQALLADLGPIELCVTPDPTHIHWREVCLPEALIWTAQGEGDLGQRLSRAAKRTTDTGMPVLFIGTDCPGLDVTRLHEAAQALAATDAIMIPAFDGGYVLLGLHRHAAALFEEIPWSTPQVASMTRQRIAEQGWHCTVLAAQPDIDTADDLRWLPQAWEYE